MVEAQRRFKGSLAGFDRNLVKMQPRRLDLNAGFADRELMAPISHGFGLHYPDSYAVNPGYAPLWYRYTTFDAAFRFE